MNHGKERAFTAIDLFCGAGGVTVGLKRAGFRVLAGIEFDKEIAETYKANHPGVNLIVDDIRNLTGKKILNRIDKKNVDLVVGCPPCQGFSKLTDKWHRDDERNDLVLEMARVVAEIKPKFCMMENVSGLAQRGKKMLEQFSNKLKSEGYIVEYKVLQLADFGVPQSRKRVVLLASKKYSLTFPKVTHTDNARQSSNLKKWRTLQDVVNKKIKAVNFKYAKENGGPQKFHWKVYSDLKDITIQRLKAAKPGATRYDLPEHLRPACHKGSNKGFENVYGKLSWKQTPPTITGGFTVPAKGRFGHPNFSRALSVYEGALIQTFPKRYKFRTDKIELACQMIGNALPCQFAELASKRIYRSLQKIHP